jgi:hypothetical protein
MKVAPRVAMKAATKVAPKVAMKAVPKADPRAAMKAATKAAKMTERTTKKPKSPQAKILSMTTPGKITDNERIKTY